MSFRSLLIFFCTICSIAHAQTGNTIHGTVRDNETNEGIPGAIIKVGDDGAVTDVDGKYTINASSQSMDVSALGYVHQAVRLSPGQATVETTLSRTFVTLDSAQVTAHRFSIDSLFINAAHRVPENYLPATYTLKDAYNVQLYKPHDTVVNYRKDVYFSNSSEEWFEANCYGIKKDTGTGMLNMNEKLMVNYMPKLPLLYEENFKEKINDYRDKVHGKPYILATFTDKGEKYYDLITIDTNTKVKYSLIGKAMGYTDSKNSNVARRYVMLSEFQINAATYALIFRRDLAIETTDKDRSAFLALKTRDDLEQWMNNSINSGKRFYTYGWVFRKWKEKYYLQHLYYKDNLVYPLLKNMPLEDYTYRISYDVTDVGITLPENTVKFNTTMFFVSKAIDNSDKEKKEKKDKK